VVVTLSQNNQPYATVNASGPFGQTSGQFTYTFTSLPVGSYYVQVSAQSAAKNPGSASQKFTVASAQAVTPPSTKYAKPGVGLVNVAPNYMGKYYVANSPITFSATVTNPNGVGQLAVTASVLGQTLTPVSNSNPYTFTWTPSATGTYTLYVNATVTIGASTVSNSNSVVISVPTVLPSVTTGPTIPSRLVMTTTTPASFTFTTTPGVNAYLSINGGTSATYMTTTPISNTKLNPNVWNTLTLTFKDFWGNTIQTAVATVLGVQPQNGANTTPYLFLIDKTGHVVSNTNDWITVPAGNYLDLYGYVQAGQGQTISSYNITEQYFSNQETTAPLTNETSIASASSINSQIVPLKINAYLFNTSTTSPAFVPFNAYINGQQVKAFIRYQVEPETAGPSVSISVANTWEGVPAAITVKASNNNLQPLTGLVFSAPVNVTPASSWYGYTKPVMTAYGLTTSTTMASRVTYSVNPLTNLIAPVSAVQTYGANAYGFVTGSKTYYVAFYGPSGTYSLKATVTNIANAIANPSTTYLVQADTSAPIANITLSGSYVTVNGEKVYYAPQLKATFNINDDHAIYWAKLSFATNLQVYYPNNNQIYNYGVQSQTATATVSFNNGVGNYTFWPIATDKHFDAKTYSSALATTTAIGTGNIVNQATTTVYYDNGSQLSASLLGGQYNAGINSEDYEFVVKASDGNGIGLSSTATVYVKTLSGSLVSKVPATLTPGATAGYYTAIFDTYSVPNGFYSVSLGVNDLMYSLLPPAYQSAHTVIVPWGQIEVNNAYPNVTISNAGVTLGATVKTISSDLFKISVRDPQLQAWWNGINSSNYQQYFNITLTSSYSNTVITNPMSFFRGISSATGNATTGYILIEIPQIYFNGPTTAPATVQIQVAVYNHPQDDKAIFGQSLGNFVPAPLFTNNQSTFGVNVGGSPLTYAASSATFVVVNAVSPTFPVTVNGLNLSTVSTTTNMSLYFYANGNLIDTVSAASFVNGSSQQVNVPTSAGLSTVALSVIYAPSPVRNSAAKAKVLSSPVGYQYSYPLGTLHVLGDVTPVATLSLGGKSINGLSNILTTNNSSATFVVGAPAFYYHDILTKYETFLGMNTTLTGNVLVKTFANQSGTNYPLNLGALTKLASATLAQGNQYVVTTTAGNTPLAFSKAGVYTLTFNPTDPFVGYSSTLYATVVVDPYAPVISGVTLNGNSVANVTSGIVPTIANGNTISAVATDYAGVKSASINITDLIDNAATTYAMTNHFGIGTFSATVQTTVALPQVFSPQYQNLPYEVTFYATNVAGMGAAPVTRLFVTNVDHSPKILNIVAYSPNQLKITLSEPMWVNGFKAFTAYSATYGGTITSANITPVSVLATYQGAGIATTFYVTFGYSIWTPSQVGNSALGDLSNIELSSSLSSYVPIVDLAGNQYGMPIYTTTPPTLFVTPTSTVVGKGANVTFTVNATSAAGISKIVGSYYGQTKTVYGPTGSMPFVSPTVSGTYTASFTAYDQSVNQNHTTVTAVVYVNTALPTLTLTAPATVGSNQSFLATATVSIGDYHGGNKIVSVKIGGFTATNVSDNKWQASVTLTGNGSMPLVATATDLYGNSASISKNVYVDGQAPTITVTLTGGTGLTSSPYTLTPGSSVTLYTSSTTGLSGTVDVTDNSKMPVTAIVTEMTTIAFATTAGASVTTFKATGTANGSLRYTIKASSTDKFGHNATYLATFTLVVDPTGPTVAATVLTPLSTTSTYASVTYKAFDTISGIVGSQATLTIASKVAGTTPVTLYVNSTAASKTINVLPSLLANGFAGKSGEATVTVTAKSNSGVVKSTTNASTVITFNFTFNIEGATRLTSAGSPVVITFNTVAKANSSFVPSDVYFVNGTNGLTYQASAIQVPNGTTKVATITQFSVLGSGALVTSQNLPAGSDYTLYVSNIVGATPTTNNAQVANSPYTGFSIHSN
jgi:hypothetical protein